MIKKGTTSIDGIYKGTTEIAEIRKGTALVYENYKTLTSEGVPPLTLSNCKNTNMLGYKVYGNSVQQSKNLLDIQTAPRVGVVRATITNSGNGVKVTATSANNSCDFWINITSLIPGEQYTISFTTERTATTGGGIRLYVGNSMKVNNLNLSAGNYSFTFTAGESVSIYFYGASNNNVVGDYAIFTNVQLEKGSSATSYVSPNPTPEYPVEIQSVGDKTKNIWNSTLIAGCMKFADGQYLNYPGYVCNATPISVEAGETYTISANNYDDPESTSTGFVFYNNGTFVSSLITTSLTVTIPTGVNQLYYDFRKQSSASSLSPSDITNVQLEKGSSPTNYELYGYKIPITVTDSNNTSTTTNIYLDAPLRKSDNASDYIDLETQKVVRYINKMEASEITRYFSNGSQYTNGNCRFQFGSIGNNTDFSIAPMSNGALGHTGGIVGGANNVTTSTQFSYFYWYLDATAVGLEPVTETTSNSTIGTAIKNYLINNNVNLYYARVTPTEENITLPDILLNKGTNIVSVGTGITPSNMWIKYKGK